MRLSTTADSMDFKTPFAMTGANICSKIAMLRAPSTSSLAVDNPSICTVYFGEYHNQGPGADLSKRAPFAKQLSDAEVKPFISLAYIEGSKWLLPPATPRV
ncbi:UNVERIFIED_CONTAM: Pectinesterase PPME1 [Sesamum latifolium]|uniref:Pectinesterase PPME1 n=1 Tax=Sesamum latifolium TaxID=2727402 RepID=A0AAW2T8I0_9LAMI